GLSGKWLEVLKEIAPIVTRAAVIRDPALASGPGQFAAIQSIAPSLGVEVSPVNVRDAGEIERAITAFAHSPNGGLIVTGSALVGIHRHLIIALAARHKLPAVYVERTYVAAGGLVSYGSDFLDQYRRAASYVDRILKGEKPADLPVQAPTKYELVINLKTAHALALESPPTLLPTPPAPDHAVTQFAAGPRFTRRRGGARPPGRSRGARQRGPALRFLDFLTFTPAKPPGFFRAQSPKGLTKTALTKVAT